MKRTIIAGVVASAVVAGTYLGLLGWHRAKETDPATGNQTGPYHAWQVILVAVVVALVAVAHKMSDQELIETLAQVRGIGRWTVEMLLIFRLGRPDVLSVDDYGVRKGFAKMHKLTELPKPKELAAYGERWHPYRSVACWIFVARRRDERPALRGTFKSEKGSRQQGRRQEGREQESWVAETSAQEDRSKEEGSEGQGSEEVGSSQVTSLIQTLPDTLHDQSKSVACCSRGSYSLFHAIHAK